MITIKKNSNGDTRTAPKDVSFEQFQEANDMHRADVASVMHELSRIVDIAGKMHDFTKKSQEKMFYRDFLATMNSSADFVASEWYQVHVHAERHHLSSYCPVDVTLIDIMEMLVDCVCAGMARSGEVRDLELNNEIMSAAVKNTVDLIKSMIVLEDD